MAQIMFDPALLASLLPNEATAAADTTTSRTSQEEPLVPRGVIVLPVLPTSTPAAPAANEIDSGIPRALTTPATPIPASASAAVHTVATGCGYNKYSTGNGTCTSCPENRYTITYQAVSKAECLVQPGYGIVSKTGPPEDRLVEPCVLGMFSKGGALDTACLACESNTWTEGLGATACSGKR
jgi:hypothetical protein